MLETVKLLTIREMVWYEYSVSPVWQYFTFKTLT